MNRIKGQLLILMANFLFSNQYNFSSVIVVDNVIEFNKFIVQ